MACAGHFGDMEVSREPFWQAMFDYRRVTLIGMVAGINIFLVGHTMWYSDFLSVAMFGMREMQDFRKGCFRCFSWEPSRKTAKKSPRHERITRSSSWMKKSVTGLAIWRNPNGWFMALFYNVVKTMPCLPPMTGNGKHTTFKNGDDWGMVVYFVRRNSSSVIKMAWWENFGTSSTYQRCIFHCHVEPEGIPCHGGWSCWQGSTKVLRIFSDC